MNTEPFSAWALLRENRSDFISQPRSGSVEIIAAGRNEWDRLGELTTEAVDEWAIHMAGHR